MKIAASEIEMASSHTAMELDQKSEQLTVWSGNGRTTKRSVQDPRAHGSSQDKLTLSDAASMRLRALRQSTTATLTSETAVSSGGVQSAAGSDDGEAAPMDGRTYLLKEIVEAMTGREIHVGSIQLKASGQSSGSAPSGGQTGASAASSGQASQGWGLAYDSSTVHYESESTSFSAKGVIQTADGRRIGFSIDLQMSREYLEETSTSIRAGDAVAVDPLVINFNGSSADLTDEKYSFDLNSDGTEEQMSFVGQGSGLLALDLNQDGVVNDGSELFGTASGDGFADLAAYDEDGNGWIDENDSIYNKLSVWTKDEEGNDELSGLADKDVGAIYLGSIATLFSVKDAENNLDGELVSTGVYLHEDGQAGTVQQVNMVV
ncbi:MAG: hypothetical protein AB7W37_06655 [Syntrophobacteraceae bacterium]